MHFLHILLLLSRLDQPRLSSEDLGAFDDVPLFNILQNISALSNITEICIPAVEQVLARGREVRVEEQEEELRGRRVRLRLRPGHAQRAVRLEGEHGLGEAAAVVLGGGAVQQLGVPGHRDLQRHRAHLLAARGRVPVHLVGLRVGVARLHHEPVRADHGQALVEPLVHQIHHRAGGDGRVVAVESEHQPALVVQRALHVELAVLVLGALHQHHLHRGAAVEARQAGVLLRDLAGEVLRHHQFLQRAHRPGHLVLGGVRLVQLLALLHGARALLGRQDLLKRIQQVFQFLNGFFSLSLGARPHFLQQLGLLAKHCARLLYARDARTPTLDENIALHALYRSLQLTGLLAVDGQAVAEERLRVLVNTRARACGGVQCLAHFILAPFHVVIGCKGLVSRNNGQCVRKSECTQHSSSSLLRHVSPKSFRGTHYHL
mmetsp:Transcript_46741/g.77608  ORF Transcript_46741/g.77608 Transcript_46741/m.77608 type:complete len:432 (-) Transcript_46741:140-1435(-)